MKCFLDGNEMNHMFFKEFLGVNHEYVKCNKCGLVIDKTIYEMSPEERALCNSYHKDYQGSDYNPVDPRWIERLKSQSAVIVDLIENHILSVENAVDYGCGDGKFSEYIKSEYESRTGTISDYYPVKKYDKYMEPDTRRGGYLDHSEVYVSKFDFVVSCSVFEHLIGKKDVNEILSLANEKGVVGIHTLICEAVPDDSDWFYLLLNHCTLWTNSAMAQVYKEYGYVGCAYSIDAQMWFFFKDIEKYNKLVEKQEDIKGNWVISNDFVDYWKKKPYRNE